MTKNKKIPIYKQIYQQLSQEIADGLYDGEEYLPGEYSLCERFGVERATLRNALKLLVEDGIVEKVPGKGTRLMGKEKTEKNEGARKNVLLVFEENYMQNGNGEQFHFRLIRNIEKKLSDMGLNLMMKTLEAGDDPGRFLRQMDPAAMIFDSYISDGFYEEAISAGLPCISVNHYTPKMTSVVSNNFDGAYQAVKMLARAGHTKIGYITGKEKYQTNIERFSGVMRWYAQNEQKFSEKYLFKGQYTYESGRLAGEKIAEMSESERPTAVFAFNNDMAYGCYRALTEHGIRVPEDISLVGFDYSEGFGAGFPEITSVDVNLNALTSYTCWYLKGAIDGTVPLSSAKIQIEVSLVEGKTVKKI